VLDVARARPAGTSGIRKMTAAIDALYRRRVMQPTIAVATDSGQLDRVPPAGSKDCPQWRGGFGFDWAPTARVWDHLLKSTEVGRMTGQDAVPDQGQNPQWPVPYSPTPAVQYPPAAPQYAPRQPPQAGLVPERPIMTKQTYASRMSYVGVTRRTGAWIRRVGSRSALRASLAWSLGLLFLLFMYLLLIPWYILVFVVFGLWTIPFRLIRRGQRKSQHLQAAQLATMQAMLVQQQQVVAENQKRMSSGPQ